MESRFRILVDGAPLEASVYDAIASVEVEESVELPGAVRLSLPVDATDDDDLTFVGEAMFKPYAKIAVVVEAGEQPSECIFDGYVLSHKVHLVTGTTASTLAVWGQDASWLMNLEEKVKEWADVTDSAVAASIFGDYDITPGPDNASDDSPSHTEAGHTLMQRASDLQFLRQLARRNGKIFRVACKGEPGQPVGYFAKPDLSAEPKVTLVLNDVISATVRSLDFEWDVTRPSEVAARQALFDDPAEDGVSGDASDSGLPTLADRGLSDFAGKPMKVLLTAPVDDAGELVQRAQSVLREAGFFVRCTGEADAHELNAVLRAGTVVKIAGAGKMHSGKYYVWSVRHTITRDSYKMSFVLVRNAVGPAS